MDRRAKRTVLVDLLVVHGAGERTIVFTQTKREADFVASCVTVTIPCEALHGDIPQQQRELTLERFRQGKFSVLVATDVAARGLDIPNVDLVVHYDIPQVRICSFRGLIFDSCPDGVIYKQDFLLLGSVLLL